MGDQKDNCKTGACPVVGNGDNKTKLIKSTDLPLHGNPYPQKDVIQDDTPSSLELAVRSVRTSVQPFLTPVCTAYRKTSDIVSIGAAHTQSTFATLQENQSTLKKGSIISAAGLLGFVLARRRGIFKRLIFSSALAGGTALFLYPREFKHQAELAYLMAKNRLPTLAQEQYRNLTGAKPTSSAPNVTDKVDSDTSQPKAPTS